MTILTPFVAFTAGSDHLPGLAFVSAYRPARVRRSSSSPCPISSTIRHWGRLWGALVLRVHVLAALSMQVTVVFENIISFAMDRQLDPEEGGSGESAAILLLSMPYSGLQCALRLPAPVGAARLSGSEDFIVSNKPAAAGIAFVSAVLCVSCRGLGLALLLEEANTGSGLMGSLPVCASM